MSKTTRRIEIVHYRRVIVSEGVSAAAEPVSRGSDLVLTELRQSEAVDAAVLTGDDVPEERLPRSKFARWRALFTAPSSVNSR